MRRLLIRPGAIGDCILALPAMQFLAQDYTEVWISSPLVTLVKFASTVKPLASTGIDLAGIEGVPAPEHLERQLQTFDRVVSWYGANRPDFRRYIEGIVTQCEFHPALPPEDYDGHATDFFSEQVGAPAGLVARIEAPHPAAPRNSIVIHPFSGSITKNWPLDSFRALAEHLPVPVEWTAGPDEMLDNAARFERLDDLASWVSGARLFIGNDSGITHLAGALGVPVLEIFGPTSPERWAPRGGNVTVIQGCRLDELSVSVVLDQALQKISLEP